VRKPAFALLSLGLPALASAQSAAPPPRSVTLRDTIVVAVKQNRALLSADADIEVAEANQLAARGNEDFLLDGSAQVTARRTSPVENSPFQQEAFDNLHAELGASQPLWYGGRIGLRASHDYTRVKNLLQIEGVGQTESTSSSYTPSLQLNYFMPLLRGFGEENMRSQRRRTLAARTVAELDRENSVANVVRDVVQAYWELAYAAQDLDIRRSSLGLAQEQLRITQARLDVGVGSPTDVAAVKQAIATREEDVILGELTLADRALDVRTMTGMNIAPNETDLAAADKLEPSVQAVDLDKALQAAYDANPQIVAVRARGHAATIEVEIADNGLLPQLDLNASFGPTGTASNESDALDRLAKFKDYQVFASVTFSMPVSRSLAKGTRAAAVGQLHKARLTEDDLKVQVAVAVVRAVNLVRASEKRLTVDAEAVQQAQINLDAEKARFQVGKTTNFEVLRRQDELAQSQLRRTRAAADYLKATAVLQTLTGQLLPAYGVTVKPRS
jgi:outer membrane protein TolC